MKFRGGSFLLGFISGLLAQMLIIVYKYGGCVEV